ncbi:MAG: hypothetical protein N2Z20_04770 [Elusimicrobiales bacterium]|nr:hypothetical protein [Elusimicrobiales bacterium]
MVKAIKTLSLFFISILQIIRLSSLEEKEITNKEIKVNIEFSGITHPYDEYDIRAEFDGNVMFVYASNFDIVKKSDILLRLVTGEVAALLKTAKDPQEKKDILKRWKNMFRYSDIKTPTDGIITKIHVDKDSFVKKGDKLITIARKMRVIAKNTKPLNMTPVNGLDAIVETQTQKKYRAVLNNFIQEGEGKWRFFLDFEKITDVKVGEKVTGVVIVANKTATRVIPNSDVLEYGGKKYILIEFEPGIISENETEIISFKYNYLKITKEILNYVK